MRNLVASRKLFAAVMLVLLSLPLMARASEFKLNLKTTLTGHSFDGEMTKARSEFEMESSSKKLAVEVGNINLPAGSVVNIWINGAQLGAITIRNHGGTLLKSTYAGQTVPNVNVGSTIKVTFGSTVLASGKF
jgi:hypothetical protein